MLLMQLDSRETKPLPPIGSQFVLPQRQLIAKAEVRITLRGRSESPPIRRANYCGNSAVVHYEGSNGTAAITLRRHSVATASQYAPISEDQLEDARQTIGLQAPDSAVLVTCARDLEMAATKQLPPLHPRSLLLRTAAGIFNVGQNQAQESRHSSGNFSSTLLINTPRHACVTRSKSFKTLRRCESPDSYRSSSPSPRPLLARHASFETALPGYSEESDIYFHVPVSKPSEDPLPRLRSVASIDNFAISNPNAKLPPAHPAAAPRNGAIGMLASNKGSNSPAKHPSFTQSAKLHDSTSSPSLERSAVNIVMPGGGPESTSPSNQGPHFLPREAIPTKRLATRPVIGRHYSRIQLPCTKASSRSNTRVMTDSLKLYEEQIFSYQISSGQRPLSWCIDLGTLAKSMAQTPDDNSSGSPSVTNSSSTMSSACSSSSSSNASHAVGPPRIGHFNRPACLRPGAIVSQSGLSSNSKSRNLSPIIHAVRPGSPQCPPLRLQSPSVPPGAVNRVPSRGCPADIRQSANVFFATTSATPEASTPNAEEQNKSLRVTASAATGTNTSSGTSTSFTSSLSTVRPGQCNTPTSQPSTPPLSSLPPPLAGDDSSTTLETVRPDGSFPTPSLSMLPPPAPWNNSNSFSSASINKNEGTGSVVRQLFVCPYCRALPTLCRCSASLNSVNDAEGGEGSLSFEGDSEDEEESTYAFSTLDSDFIAWMRLSVKNVTSSHPCYAFRRAESLAALTQQEVVNIANIFNTNPLGLRMNLVEGTSKLVGTIRVYINLIKPVKMSLRQTIRHMPRQAADVAVPDRLISFFLPRGGSRLLQLSSSTSAQEVIQCLLDRFHIQESSSKFALYEHTLETQTILSRKLPPSERPLSMLMHWVRSTLSAGEDFAVVVRRKRIVLQENENWEVNWSDFTPAELMNFLRILEKEEAEYRNAIYFQYGLVRQQIEQRMAQLSAQDRLLAARHSVATCPPPEHLLCLPPPDQQPPTPTVPIMSQSHHASL
ncbi:Ras association domain-containing protein 5 [Echinococcus granulosus]|uniref:Ras association domain-containing protein 5 n=1 Tax=Echinococcus granulosus TaxID=6210 RepID=W6UY28_ECHGR|nr:Ras association domain-containing protein 5 [Echinococcus granulosus]EUB63507.1 Ras association domain-containing protein 5 [Echinococcus granulosus]